MYDRSPGQIAAEVAISLLGIVTILLANDPELPGKLAYRFRLWLAYRQDTTNYARLRYMREMVRAGHYDDDVRAE